MVRMVEMDGPKAGLQIRVFLFGGKSGLGFSDRRFRNRIFFFVARIQIQVIFKPYPQPLPIDKADVEPKNIVNRCNQREFRL